MEFAGGEKIPFDDVTVAREKLREARRPRSTTRALQSEPASTLGDR